MISIISETGVRGLRFGRVRLEWHRACNAFGPEIAWEYPHSGHVLRRRILSLTFWHRAMASVGRLQGWRHSDGFHVGAHLFGYAVTVEGALRYCEKYHRTLLSVNVPWAAYDSTRGIHWWRRT